MALVGTRVETQQDGDTAVAVRTDVLVDTETGLLLERKTVVAEVLTESGNHKAVIAGQKTSIAAVQPRGTNTQYRAIQSGPTTQYRSTTTDDDKTLGHVMFCLLSICCPPCICCWIMYCLTE